MKKTILLVLVLALGLAVEVAKADFTFGTPINLGPAVNTSANEGGPFISADSLQLYFSTWDVHRPGGYGGSDIWVATRETTNDPWGEPVNLSPIVNSSSNDGGACIPAEGLELFFSSNRPGGYGGVDIWVTTRPTKDDEWGSPVNLGPTVNSSANECVGSISADGLELYFMDWGVRRPGGYGGIDIWVTTRTTKDDPWGEPVNLGPTVNSSAHDKTASISADGLALFFCSTRPGGYGWGDLYVTTRETIEDDWEEPVNLGSTINTSAWDDMPNISADGSTLFFTSDRPRVDDDDDDYDIWQVSIEPVVDLNGDGIVDFADMRIMAGYWGENYPLCDIGPMPWGDGIVDVNDLIVLTEYLMKEKIDVEADIAAINELYDLYCLGANTGDLDLFISCWDENGIQMPSNTIARIGKEQIRERMEPLFDLYIYELSITPEEVEVAGDWAFGRRTYTLTLTPKAGGEPIFIDGKALTIFKRQADGSWKIFRDCFNRNV